MVSISELQQYKQQAEQSEQEAQAIANAEIPQRRYAPPNKTVSIEQQQAYIAQREEARQALPKIQASKEEINRAIAEQESYESAKREYEAEVEAAKVARQLWYNGTPAEAMRGEREFKYLKQLEEGGSYDNYLEQRRLELESKQPGGYYTDPKTGLGYSSAYDLEKQKGYIRTANPVEIEEKRVMKAPEAPNIIVGRDTAKNLKIEKVYKSDGRSSILDGVSNRPNNLDSRSLDNSKSLYTGGQGMVTRVPEAKGQIERLESSLSTVRRSGGYKAALAGLGSSFIQPIKFTKEIIFHPIQTTKTTATNIFGFKKSLTTGFPEVSDILRNEPEYATGYALGNIALMGGASKVASSTIKIFKPNKLTGGNLKIIAIDEPKTEINFIKKINKAPEIKAQETITDPVREFKIDKKAIELRKSMHIPEIKAIYNENIKSIPNKASNLVSPVGDYLIGKTQHVSNIVGGRTTQAIQTVKPYVDKTVEPFIERYNAVKDIRKGGLLGNPREPGVFFKSGKAMLNEYYSIKDYTLGKAKHVSNIVGGRTTQAYLKTKEFANTRLIYPWQEAGINFGYSVNRMNARPGGLLRLPPLFKGTLEQVEAIKGYSFSKAKHVSNIVGGRTTQAYLKARQSYYDNINFAQLRTGGLLQSGREGFLAKNLRLAKGNVDNFYDYLGGKAVHLDNIVEGRRIQAQTKLKEAINPVINKASSKVDYYNILLGLEARKKFHSITDLPELRHYENIIGGRINQAKYNLEIFRRAINTDRLYGRKLRTNKPKLEIFTDEIEMIKPTFAIKSAYPKEQTAKGNQQLLLMEKQYTPTVSSYYGKGQYERSDFYAPLILGNKQNDLVTQQISAYENNMMNNIPLQIKQKAEDNDKDYSLSIKSLSSGSNLERLRSRDNILTRPKERNKLLDKYLESNRFGLSSNSILKNNESIKQNFRQLQKLRQKTPQKTIYKFKLPSRSVRVMPFPSSTRQTNVTSSSYSDAFKTLVKRFGKWQQLPGVRSKGEAIKLGESKAINTLARSFKIEPTGESIPVSKSKFYSPSEAFRDYRVVGGKKKKLDDEWIQRTIKSLSSPGERVEIFMSRILNKHKRRKR